MKASTVLSKARTLIATSGHTKGELARNKYRHKVDPTSHSAVKFCAFGAIQNVLGVPDKGRATDGTREVERVSWYLGQAIPSDNGISRNWWCVDDYNDLKTVTLKDVDKWFSRAIKIAKKVGN